MNTTLKKRVAELERVALARSKKPINDASSIDPEVFYQLRKKFAIGRYSDWRYEALTLEELLALARDDDARELASVEQRWRLGLRPLSEGKWVPFGQAEAVREIEIRILERDRLIDDTTARALRDNAYEHFYREASTRQERGTAPPLAELPCSLDIDQEKLLAAALTKCPRRETLSLEQQLALAHEDQRRKLIERAKPRTYPPGIKPPLSGLDALCDKLHQQRVEELERLICERDDASNC
jgi:hypothetical protein